MPTSSTENKEKIVKWYKEIAPLSVIDIGPGKGTYAKLLKPFVADTHWTGIEAWAPYINQYNLEQYYNYIVIADARVVDYERIGNSSLVIMGDVLEHMTKFEAIDLINRVKKFTENIIISIPLWHLDQAPVEGNWFEIHKDHWEHKEMKDFLSDGLVASIEGAILGYYWWRK